jgi:hypothetical protein
MQYGSQSRPQDAYLELDLETGKLTADYNGEIGNAVSSHVWHGRVQRINFAPLLKIEKINELMDDLEDLCQKILDNSSVDWNGSNYVGNLTDEGREAHESACRTAEEFGDEDDLMTVANFVEWFYDVKAEIVDSANQIGVDATMKKFMDESDVWIFEGQDTGRQWIQDELDIQDNEMAFDLATIEEDRFEKIVAQVREIRAELKNENADDK